MSRKLYSYIAVSVLLFLGTTAFSSTALAQTASDEESNDSDDSLVVLEEVVITGSIIRRAETETASPMSVLTAEELDIRGLNTVSEAVQQLPANNAGSMSAQWNAYGFASGATAVSLRGLTAGATLTIFDGMRSAPYPLGDDGRRNFVDLGTIPDAIVERIEVLKDGGSATYGADAVAGVVNVITKKEITGVHFNGSYGLSKHGDANEYRVDLTAGYGQLDDQGFNFYVNVESQKDDPLFARDRGFPENGSRDLSTICNAAGVCMQNSNPNGIQADGSFLSVGTTSVPMVRPYDPATTQPSGNWRLLNPSAGCRNLTPHNLTPEQSGGIVTGPVCEQDIAADYYNFSPEAERNGANARFTMLVGDNAEAYAMANYYEVKTASSTTPRPWADRTAAGGTTVTISPFFLPVYICPVGIDSCDATNGVLNPNNPFAADGQIARLNYYYPRQRSTNSKAQTTRFAAGIHGSFGGGVWDYTLDAVTSSIRLDVKRNGYPNARNLLNVAHDGSYNFLDPAATPEAVIDYVSPEVSTVSHSDVDQIQGTIGRAFFDLPGGELMAAVGMSYRKESIDNPSANPPNEIDPYDRYYSLNSVATSGSRNVWSGFFEIDAPITDMLDVNVSGRYDDYSSGQTHFSPKIGVIFQPIDSIKLRGTWGKGFRIPSFNEAYGEPTTGYITTKVNATDPGGADFLAAHDNNAYSTLSYSVGLTSTGNPALEPETSTSYSFGFIYEPTNSMSFTVDYYHILLKDLVSNVDYGPAIDAYYANNGVVDLPGINVVPGIPDPDHPNALPNLGFVQYSYRNADQQIAEGLDFGASFGHELGGDAYFNSHLDASYLIRLSKTIDGVEDHYEGTLSPCDVTSCSGSPSWRGTWANWVDWHEWTFALTANYTGGYDLASVDYGGVEGDCEASLDASVPTYVDGTPVMCNAKAYLDFDFTVSYQVNEKFQLYANILNLFDKKAPFNPGAAYGLYNWNPAWESSGFRGQYFRLGLRYDF